MSDASNEMKYWQKYILVYTVWISKDMSYVFFCFCCWIQKVENTSKVLFSIAFYSCIAIVRKRMTITLRVCFNFLIHSNMNTRKTKNCITINECLKPMIFFSLCVCKSFVHKCHYYFILIFFAVFFLTNISVFDMYKCKTNLS